MLAFIKPPKGILMMRENNVLTLDIINIIIIKGPEYIFIKHWNEVNFLYVKIRFIVNNILQQTNRKL